MRRRGRAGSGSPRRLPLAAAAACRLLLLLLAAAAAPRAAAQDTAACKPFDIVMRNDCPYGFSLLTRSALAGPGGAGACVDGTTQPGAPCLAPWQAIEPGQERTVARTTDKEVLVYAEGYDDRGGRIVWSGNGSDGTVFDITSGGACAANATKYPCRSFLQARLCNLLLLPLLRGIACCRCRRRCDLCPLLPASAHAAAAAASPLARPQLKGLAERAGCPDGTYNHTLVCKDYAPGSM